MREYSALIVLAAAVLGADGPFTYEKDPAWEAHDGRIEITVLDNEARPVADCLVRFAKAYEGSVEEALKEHPPARTGPDGRIVFSDLPYDWYRMYADNGSAGGMAMSWLEPKAPVGRVELKLRVGHSIEGTVRDDQRRPLSGVAVVVDKMFVAATTDEQGRFRMPHLAEDANIEMAFVKDGYGVYSTHVTPHDKPFIVTLKPGAKLRVTVLDAQGEPLRNGRASYSESNGFFWTNVTTDQEGRFTTLDLPHGTEIRVNANLEQDGFCYSGETLYTVPAEGPADIEVRLKPTLRLTPNDVPAPNGVTLVTYYPVDAPPGVPVTGKVLQKPGKRPAMATVICELKKDELMVRTQADGSFVFENVPEGNVGLSVKPDDPMLYDPGSVQRLTVSSDGKPGDVDFNLEKGGVITGRVVTASGKPPERQEVRLRPSVRHLSEPIDVEADGSFRFAHVPPSDTPYEVAAVEGEKATVIASAVAGALSAGQTIADVQITLPPTPADETLGTVNGVVVDESGAPVSEVKLDLPDEFAVTPAFSDDLGAFELPFRKVGEARLKVSRWLRPHIGDQFGHIDAPPKVLEGEVIVLSEQKSAQPAKVVVRIPSNDLLGGTITDGSGNPINPEYIMWHSETSTGSWGNTNGSFMGSGFGESPVVIEAYHKGYQAKILLEGRDFQRGDVDIDLILKPGPFPKYTSIFEAVTGFKSSERNRLPRADQIWQNLPQYRRMAGNDEALWVRVVDKDGKPVNKLNVLRWNEVVRGLPDTVAEDRLKSTTMEGENGYYTFEVAQVYVWSEGTGRVWFAPRDPIERADLIELTLVPAATVRLKVTDDQGQPLSGVSVLGSEIFEKDGRFPYPHTLFSPETQPGSLKPPVTDKDGYVTFASLAPGRYEFYAPTPEWTHPKIEVELEAGEKAEQTVTLQRRVPQEQEGTK